MNDDNLEFKVGPVTIRGKGLVGIVATVLLVVWLTFWGIGSLIPNVPIKSLGDKPEGIELNQGQ